jgi:hypothetical protein
LDGPLQAFIEFFEISPFWVAAGAAASPVITKGNEPLEQWIAELPEEECRQLLLRVAQDESATGLFLRRELHRRFTGTTSTLTTPKPRTVAQLARLVQESARRGREEKRRQQQQKRQRLEILSEQEPTLWAQVLTCIQ